MLQDLVSDFIAEQSDAVTAAPTHIAFGEQEYSARLDRLAAAMERDRIDTLVLSSPEAQNWLHGLQLRWYKAQSPMAWRPLTCTAVRSDGRYLLFEGVEHTEMIRRTSVASDVRLLPRNQRAGMLEFIVSELLAAGWIGGQTVGLELHSHVPNAAVSAMLRAAIMDAGATVVDGSATARGVRAVKSKAELDAVREAARICDAGLAHLAEVLIPGMTELEAHGELIRGLSNAGGEPAGLHQVVSIGSGALGTGHEISGNRRIQPGDMIEVDACGVHKRYHANRNMVFFVGEPGDGASPLQRILAGAFDLLRENARAGTRVGQVNALLLDYYTQAGVFSHNTDIWIGGYELGIAFPPDWVGEWMFSVLDGADDDRIFEEGLVTNFESMCGMSLIDTVVYGPEGAETLSRLPHDYAVVEA